MRLLPSAELSVLLSMSFQLNPTYHRLTHGEPQSVVVADAPPAGCEWGTSQYRSGVVSSLCRARAEDILLSYLITDASERIHVTPPSVQLLQVIVVPYTPKFRSHKKFCSSDLERRGH